MKGKIKKLASIFGIMVVMGLLVACGENGDDSSVAVNNEDLPPPSDEAPVRDLGGMEIVIGTWWRDYDTDTFEPQNSQQEAVLEMRRAAEERYNFRMREVNLGGWGEIQELATTSIMAGDPAAHIFILEAQWYTALKNQGLLYPVSNVVDFSDMSRTPWNRTTVAATTVGDQSYGWSIGIIEGGGIYFNMRLFEEAGLDPELPFDLQANGEWTWDAFLDISKQLTRDINNDGKIDTYAMATFSVDILGRALASNHGMYVGRDSETGDFYRATGTPEFLEALNFVNQLAEEGILMSQPEGSEWDWFNEAFLQGQVAMRTGGVYMAGTINENLADDWGFVAFPKGPNATTYQFMTLDNIRAIPSTFSTEEVDDIMFAFQLWMDTPEGFDDPNLWMNNAYLNFRHPRSVEESLVIARDQSLHSTIYHNFISGLDVGEIAELVWEEGTDPSYLIERVEQSWDAIISAANTD